MIPSCEAVAENIKKHVNAMAREIARRVEAEHAQRLGIDLANPNPDGSDFHLMAVVDKLKVEQHAREVLVEWFLGDWVPGS